MTSFSRGVTEGTLCGAVGSGYLIYISDDSGYISDDCIHDGAAVGSEYLCRLTSCAVCCCRAVVITDAVVTAAASGHISDDCISDV